MQPLLAQSALASALVIFIGVATAIHGTIVGRASADAKTSLAYASLTQVGVMFVEIGIGWTSVAVAHILGHATVRTMQFLRAPSMLHDYHQMHSAIGGERAPDETQFEDLLPEARPVVALSLGLRPRPSGHDPRPLGDSSAAGRLQAFCQAGPHRIARGREAADERQFRAGAARQGGD